MISVRTARRPGVRILDPMYLTSNFFRSPRFLLGVAVILLVLSFIPMSGSTVLEAGIDRAGAGAVRENASGYLETQRERALEGFLVLSALKVGLAVLRSSEIGLVLNVKIGDLAIAVYDYVNFAWKVLLAAVAYYYLAGYILDLARALEIWFLWAGLVLIVLAFGLAVFRPGWPKSKVILLRAGTVAFVFTVMTYLALPLAFVGAGWVSAHITGKPIEETGRLFQEIRDDISGIGNSNERNPPGKTGIRTPSVTVPVPFDGTDSSAMVLENHRGEEGAGRFHAGIAPMEKIRELREYLQERSRSLASAVLRQTAAYLFDIVVFPLLMLVVLYGCGKYSISLALPSRSYPPGSGNRNPEPPYPLTVA